MSLPIRMLLPCGVVLLLASTGGISRGQDDSEFVNKYFEAPYRLMVGDVPLNTAASQMYPSPAMFDIDNDGQKELIVGDIFGTLNVYENQTESGQAGPIWSEHTALTTTTGDAIKVNNW